MNSKLISNIRNKIKKVSVLVIGDLMLDEYLDGTVRRISPEAPVPVLNLEKNLLIPGGAANVAMNVAGLGANVFLVGLIGKDSKGNELKKILSDSISVEGVLESTQRRTTVKTRVTAHQQQIVRIDQEDVHPLKTSELNLLWNYIVQIIQQVNIVIVSDYNKGILHKNLLSRLIKAANGRKLPVVVDPKGKDFLKYRGSTILTPNRAEFAVAIKSKTANSEFREAEAVKLIKKLQLDSLLVTLGDKGMRLYEKNKAAVNYPATARRVYDVTGAGDTVIAVLAVLLAAGCTLDEATRSANLAAGMVVEEAGTTAISIEKLLSVLSTEADQIL